MLSRGEYLAGLYDIGFDRPESQALAKAGSVYFVVYAPKWKGRVALRGLKDRGYRVQSLKKILRL